MGSTVLTPTPKVTAAAITGAIVVILSWLVNVIFHISLPIEVGSLLNLVLMSAAGYIKRDKVKFN